MDFDSKKARRIARAILSGDIDVDVPSRRGTNGLALFLAGLGAGAALGLLFAPGSGEETRSQLADSAREGYEKARSKTQEFAQRAQEAVGRRKEQGSETMETPKQGSYGS